MRPSRTGPTSFGLAGIESITPAAISADRQIVLFRYRLTLSDLYLAEELK